MNRAAYALCAGSLIAVVLVTAALIATLHTINPAQPACKRVVAPVRV